MPARVWSAAVRGIEGYSVSVELDLANGLPVFTTVGLPDGAVRESRERVAAALRNSGFDVPCRRVTVNLAPAEFRKRGTQFDLPVALGLLAASGQIPAGDWMSRFCLLGELALDGRVQPVSGVLAMAIAAKACGLAAVMTARSNASEAACVGMPVFGVASLKEAADFTAGRAIPAPAAALPRGSRTFGAEDWADVKGQSLAKRALEIAAAGRHHVLLMGPPGSGKSMLARRLTGLLPPLEEDEALEVAQIRSVAGGGAAAAWPSSRPFRAPHHGATAPALVGGGNPCRPGEATLAHHGVLFLDELAEFGKDSLEALRVPLESGRILVSRAQESLEFPADFQLVAAMNPCPCGYLGHPRKECLCTPPQIARYRSRVSGPLLDRFDLRVEVAPLSFAEWHEGAGDAEASEPVRKRVARVRRASAERLGNAGRTNASMRPAELRAHCRFSAASRDFLETAADRFSISTRGLDRILRVARTIADLGESRSIDRGHLAEAVALSGRGQG